MAKSSKQKKWSKSVYTMHEAKTNLSQLVKKAINGEEVILANGSTPVAKIIPFTETPKRTFGSMKGRLSYTDDAFAPLTDEELKDWGYE